MSNLIQSNRNLIKEENLVSITVWHCLDTSNSDVYNNEYTIYNEITHQSWSYSEYYNGEFFKKYAEDQYVAQVKMNESIIERVKVFLNDKRK